MQRKLFSSLGSSSADMNVSSTLVCIRMRNKCFYSLTIIICTAFIYYSPVVRDVSIAVTMLVLVQ